MSLPSRAYICIHTCMYWCLLLVDVYLYSTVFVVEVCSASDLGSDGNVFGVKSIYVSKRNRRKDKGKIPDTPVTIFSL